ncbi:MAG: pyridoxamine 5'-phosphate oxidase family protein [Myxococcota bacterium]
MPEDPRHVRLKSLDLDALHGELWAWLGRGVADRKSPLRTPTLSCLDGQGRPSARVIVLRAADPTSHTLTFHTDVRAGKVKGLRRSPWVEWVFWDPGLQIQIRARGVATLHHHDELAATEWARIHPGSQRVYLAHPAPGTAVDVPTSGLTPAQERGLSRDEDAAPGFANFAVVRCTVRALEWLLIARSGHQRAQINYTADGERSGQWLVP